MEHIIQFGITIDDEAIKQRIESQALDALTDKISAEIKSNLPKHYNGKVNWEQLAYEGIDRFIQENKETIMNMAAEDLVSQVKRTKVWREKYGKVLNEQD